MPNLNPCVADVNAAASEKIAHNRLFRRDHAALSFSFDSFPCRGLGKIANPPRSPRPLRPEGTEGNGCLYPVRTKGRPLTIGFSATKRQQLLRAAHEARPKR